MSTTARRTAGYDHVALGFEIFWEQEDPQDEYENLAGTCPVCHGTTDDFGNAPCSAECYRAWTYVGEYDPMDYDRF